MSFSSTFRALLPSLPISLSISPLSPNEFPPSKVHTFFSSLPQRVSSFQFPSSSFSPSPFFLYFNAYLSLSPISLLKALSLSLLQTQTEKQKQLLSLLYFLFFFATLSLPMTALYYLQVSPSHLDTMAPSHQIFPVISLQNIVLLNDMSPPSPSFLLLFPFLDLLKFLPSQNPLALLQLPFVLSQ